MLPPEVLEKRIAYEKMLAEISEDAVLVHDIKGFLTNSIRKMGEILNVSRVFVFQYNAPDDVFRCLCGWDEPDAVGERKKDGFVLSIPWATRQLETGNIINYRDIRDMPGPCYRKHLLQEGIKSTLNVPLFIKGELYGFVGFDEHRYHRAWQNEDLYILTTAAQIIVRTIENKKYEEKLEEHRNILASIFSSVQDAIITVDPSLRILESNKAAGRICGIADAQGRHFAECIGACSGRCIEALQKTLEERCLIHDRQILCCPDATEGKIATVNCSPLVSGNSNFVGAVLVIRDITRLTRLETVLRDRQYYQGIVGKSEKMQELYRLLRSLVDVNATVLVSGESGTGKEKIAHALHYGGQRADKPFIKVNCGALAETLLESELFGHAKGAFTGAEKESKGRFEAADGGTILLDEIGDISAKIQLKLLRVLQEREFERVGEHKPRKVDVRVIASTNKDLKKAIAAGQFREDLFYRLNVVNVDVPPLRHRKEDIPALVDHFCMLFSASYRKAIDGVSPEVLRVLHEYDWPGNVRELEHAIEHAFVVCQDKVIGLAHIPAEIREQAQRRRPGPSAGRAAEDRASIVNALAKCGWNVSKAARLLGTSRWTLYRRMQEFAVERPVEHL